MLELVHREEDDSIYRVPYRSLAHLVRWEERLEWPRTSKLPLLSAYIAAMDDPSRSQLATEWISSNQLRITGCVDREMLVAVPVSYDAGWRATRGDHGVEIVRDSLGFLMLRTEPVSGQPIVLTYRGAPEPYLMSGFSALVWLAAFARLRRE